jgi:hypothetical protein
VIIAFILRVGMSEIDNSKLIDALEACADQLEHLNESYPKLACEASQGGVKQWRKRKGEIHLAMQEIQKRQGVEMVVDTGKLARELLVSHSIEEVLDLLLKDHGMEMDVKTLVKMAGKQSYLGSLKKEVVFLHNNGISNEQIAELWNELERPGPGGVEWTEETVTLVGGK